MSAKLELLERQIEGLTTRERRILKIWFDRLEGQEKLLDSPNVRRGNSLRAKGLVPPAIVAGSETMTQTVSYLREERERSL